MLRSPLILFFLIGLYPVVFYTSKNWFIYELNQLLFLLVIPLFTGLLGLFAHVIFRKINFIFINLALLIMTLLAASELVYSVNTKSIKNDYFVDTLNKETDDKIKFKTTPNIYLIHLESYHSPEAMKKLYGYDNREFIKTMEEKDFFVSDNNFSNYVPTLYSVGSMMLQQHHYYRHAAGLFDSVGSRDVIGGKIYNPTVSILKNNGYKVIYIHPSSYMFTGSKFLDYYFPPSRVYDSLLIFQNPLMDKFHAWLANSQFPNRRTDLNYLNPDRYYLELEKVIDIAKLSGPAFIFIEESLEVVHTPVSPQYDWRQSDEGWVDVYTQKVKNSNPKILKTIDNIVSSDPEAIIIAYGDHGAIRYRGIFGDNGGKPINEIIYERKKLSLEELALDFFGIFTAVRYPGGDPKLFDGKTPVNWFRLLFTELSGDKSLLPEKENASYLRDQRKIYRLVDDGKPLERAEIRE